MTRRDMLNKPLINEPSFEDLYPDKHKALCGFDDDDFELPENVLKAIEDFAKGIRYETD